MHTDHAAAGRPRARRIATDDGRPVRARVRMALTPLTAASIPFGPEERRRLESDGFVTLPDIIPPSGVAALNVSGSALCLQTDTTTCRTGICTCTAWELRPSYCTLILVSERSCPDACPVA